MSTFSTNDSTVNSFYLAFYGRPADPAGLKFWSAQLAANNGDMGAIVNFFAASEEAQVRFGTDTVADRITEIYSQLFNRTPDAEGMAFWTNAIEKGNASLADVAMSIQGGAQGSDATLSQLRKQAADAFTAKVEADGSDYSGYASIEAARILVRAVTPDSTSEDLDALVNAAVSFADTATKTPQVVEAIAVNTTLLALFDTARGVSEPVALAKALADTAKAAAGDPVTLESLLRGGGMDKVLKVMPAKATLVDVVEALAKGGLPAAVEVVYPTTPTAPSTPSFSISFDHVEEGVHDRAKGNTLTNVDEADITFKFSGSNSAAVQRFEASIDGGKHWNQIVVETNLATRTVTVQNVNLAGESLHPDSLPFMTLKGSDSENVITTVQLRALDGNNKVIKEVSQKIEYDGYVATPFIKLAQPESKNGFLITSTPTTASDVFDATYIEKGALVEYGVAKLPAHQGISTFEATEISWSTVKPVLKNGVNDFYIRQTDLAGNVSENSFSIVLDTEAPVGRPTITLAPADNGTSPDDSGSAGDGGIPNSSGDPFNPIIVVPGTSTQVTTSPDTVNLVIGNLDLVTNVGWEYSTNKGASWTYGGRNDGSGTAQLPVEKLVTGPIEVLVRQFDAAGNVSPASEVYTVAAAEVPPAAPEFLVGYNVDYEMLLISGTSTDVVHVDLTADSYARGTQDDVSYPSKFNMVDASKYAGDVIVHGTVAEIGYAMEGFMVYGIDGHVIADTKSHIFSGAPGERSFAQSIEFLVNHADEVKVSDTLSIEELNLFKNLANFDMEKLEAKVDNEAPLEPVVKLVTDTGAVDDNVTMVGDVEISGLEADGAFQYRTSASGAWQDGSGVVDGSVVIPMEGPGEKYIDVRQFDAAGNDSLITNLMFTLISQEQSETGTGEPPSSGDGDPSGGTDSGDDIGVVGIPGEGP